MTEQVLAETGSTQWKASACSRGGVNFYCNQQEPREELLRWVQGQTQLVNIGWRQLGSLSVLWWLMKKENRHISNQSRILGYVVEPQKKWTLEASVAGAERTRGLVQKWHKCVHAHTHDVKLSRQATVISVEKYGNRCIKAQDFEGLQGRSDMQTTQYPGLMGQCGSVRPQTVESNQYETGCKLVYTGNVYKSKY